MDLENSGQMYQYPAKETVELELFFRDFFHVKANTIFFQKLIFSNCFFFGLW